MDKNVLIVAFHYPPFAFSSGVHRAHKFAHFLPEYGWTPHVLTADPRAYPSVRDNYVDNGEISVSRAFSLDAVRHFGYKGRYPGFLALPDRWISWAPAAIYTGLKIIKKYKPQIIWTTYPIPTANIIGAALHKITGIPWVADFRDPMIDGEYPKESVKRWMFNKIQLSTVKHACTCCFTTEGTRGAFKIQHQDRPDDFWKVVGNGYDEDVFRAVEFDNIKSKKECEVIRLLHSGSIYKSQRNPSHFFLALKNLKLEGFFLKTPVKIIFRAAVNENLVKNLAHKYEITELVEILPSIPYEQALKEMLESSGLLILQGSECNRQIPAKIYEYLRAYQPIFAMVDSSGDTANFLRGVGVENIANMDDEKEIYDNIKIFIKSIKNGKTKLLDKNIVGEYSRKNQTAKLASIFDSILKK